MVVLRKAVAAGIVFVAFALGAVAQSDVEKQPQSDTVSPQSQYEFLIGDWDVDVRLRRPGKTDLEYKAKWHNEWIANGLVVLQQWNGPFATGIELRSWSPKEKNWSGRNLYLPDPGEWYENSAELVDGEMIVTTHRKNAAGESITKEIYHDIRPDHFAIRTEVSTDGGKSWHPGRYEAVMTRR